MWLYGMQFSRPQPQHLCQFVFQNLKCPLGGSYFKLKVSREHYFNLTEVTYKNSDSL